MTALFDFDGVIMDTEPQYTSFWDRTGYEMLGIEGFAAMIKGQTLVQIFEKHFPDDEQARTVISGRIDAFESGMSFGYIPGAREFMEHLRQAGVPVAIVTSSNRIKMSYVHKSHPELVGLADVILTSEDFLRSKPDPDCFLKGMKVLGAKPEDTVVFEDSFHGITAGRASGAHVVGLATTNTREAIAPRCNAVIDDFRGLTLESLRQMLSL